MTTSNPQPSAVFLWLTLPREFRNPLRGGVSEVTVAQAVEEVRSGRWAFDVTETHPATGLDVVGTLARHGQLVGDENTFAVLALAKDLGADLNRAGPDGLTALQYAKRHQNWIFAQQLERLGAQDQASLGAAGQRLVADLKNWLSRGSFRDAGRVLGDGLGPGGVTSLDWRENGVPLGLLPFQRKLDVNGASPARWGDNAEAKEVAEAFEATRELARAGLEKAPGHAFALWPWAVLSQANRWIPSDQARARAREEKHLHRLDKLMVQAFPGKEGPREVRMAQAWAAEVLDTATRLATPEDLGALRTLQSTSQAQKVAVLGVSALSAWSERLHACEQPVPAAAVAAEAWKLFERLALALPLDGFFDTPNVVENWRSGMHYALRDSMKEALRAGDGLPEGVERPWLTVATLVSDLDPASLRDALVARVMPWPEPDPVRARALLAPAPMLRADLEAARLEREWAPAAPSARGPRL